MLTERDKQISMHLQPQTQLQWEENSRTYKTNISNIRILNKKKYKNV